MSGPATTDPSGPDRPVPVDPVDLVLRRSPAPWTWTVALLAGAAAAGATAWRSALWPVVWAVWAATWVLAVTVVRHLTVDRVALVERHERLARQLGAVEWEGPGPSGPPEAVSTLVEPVLGFVPAECTDGAMPAGRVEPEDLAAVAEARQAVADGHDSVVGYRVRDGRGRLRHVEEHVEVVRGHDGEVVRRHGVVLDTTRRAVLESRAQRLMEFAELLESAAVLLRLEDLDRPESFEVRFANTAAGEHLHLWAGDRPLAGTFGSEDPLGDVPGLDRRLLDVVRLRSSFEVPVHGPFGELLRLRAVPLGDQGVGLTATPIGSAEDDAALRRMALHDPLTGLPNRTLLLDRATAALARARRIDEPLAILMVDLNHFKEVNDTLGHERGDMVLTELARRYTENLRDCDTVGRLGGDEFAVVLATGATVSGTRDVAERIARLTEQPIDLDGTEVAVGASIGAARHPDHGADATELLRRADSAMYRAKRSGATFAFFSSEIEHIEMRQLELRAGLMSAAWADHLRLSYRPRIDVQTLLPVGVEASAVWDHPHHGSVQLSDLVDVGAPPDRLSRLAHAVTEQAVAELGSLGVLPSGPVPGDTGLAVSIDMTGLPWLDSDMVMWVPKLLSALEVPRGAVCLEITQMQVLERSEVTLADLQDLRRSGVRFALGGFGSVDSSLAALRELPIDEILIHRRFVRELAEGDPTIVRTVIDLAHRLGLTAVADGVDSPEVLDRLRTLECDTALGAMAGAPMTLAELDEYLHQHVRA